MKASKFGITRRELQVLDAIVRDWSIKQTAHHYHLALSSTEQIRRRIYRKLKVRSAVGAAVKAIQEGMVLI